MSGLDRLGESERTELQKYVEELQLFVDTFAPSSVALEEQEASAINESSPNTVISITDRFRSPASSVQSLGAILELGFILGCDGYLVAKNAFSAEQVGSPDQTPATEVTFTCSDCEGEGIQDDDDCDSCGGEGELLFELNWDDAGRVYPEFVEF
jgi:hypothetical protein